MRILCILTGLSEFVVDFAKILAEVGNVGEFWKFGKTLTFMARVMMDARHLLRDESRQSDSALQRRDAAENGRLHFHTEFKIVF